jgi:hypothetical protein
MFKKQEKPPKMPSKLRIYTYDFTVDYVNPPLVIDGTIVCNGCIHVGNKEILIISGLSHQNTVAVLMHEISHAIIDCYRVKKTDPDEDVVDIISEGWSQVFRDNPDLVKFIMWSE